MNEYDVEEAKSREHKTWMELHNAKLSKKARKDSARIQTIVENAYKRDPRILCRKEEEKVEKLRKRKQRCKFKKIKRMRLHACFREKG